MPYTPLTYTLVCMKSRAQDFNYDDWQVAALYVPPVTAFATPVNTLQRFCPSNVTAKIIATAISATSSPYSTAAAPSSSCINFLMAFMSNSLVEFSRNTVTFLSVALPVKPQGC